MINLILFGPPGSGKGTQAQFIVNQKSLIHISTGDIFRKNITQQTKLGKLASEFMNQGKLVPDQLTIDLLESEIDCYNTPNGFIFDGFPRTTSQAIALDKLMTSNNTIISAMIALEVDDRILISRLIKRGKTSGRADDSNESIIKNRINEYYKKTAILKEYYQEKDRYFGINGEGQIEEISLRLKQVIDSL